MFQFLVKLSQYALIKNYFENTDFLTVNFLTKANQNFAGHQQTTFIDYVPNDLIAINMNKFN